MIDILLATYNGEKFIDSQISSILYQTNKDWHLIIHDDGSTDKTVERIKKWVKKDPRIEFIEDGVLCKSAAKNFMHLLKFSKSNYVMFCDQDDIWFDNKVEFLYNEINHMNDSKPRVVYSNSLVWIPNEGIKGLATLTFATDLKELLFLNSGIQGCVAIFDNRVRDLLCLYDGILSMHDHLLQLVACSLADIKITNLPLMLYRNHGNNVTGETKTKIIEKETLVKNRNIPVVNDIHYYTVKRFREVYNANLSIINKKILDSYLNLPSMCYLRRIYTVAKSGYKLYGYRILLILKMLFRPYMKK